MVAIGNQWFWTYEVTKVLKLVIECYPGKSKSESCSLMDYLGGWLRRDALSTNIHGTSLVIKNVMEYDVSMYNMMCNPMTTVMNDSLTATGWQRDLHPTTDNT